MNYQLIDCPLYSSISSSYPPIFLPPAVDVVQMVEACVTWITFNLSSTCADGLVTLQTEGTEGK